jgi:hypothetical protein
MSNLTIPDSLAAQLAGLPNVVHLRSSSGQALGYFVPAVPEQAGALDPGLTNEQLREIEQSGDWHTTKDVLSRLESLG